MTDDQAAREQRAKRLRGKIDALTNQTGGAEMPADERPDKAETPREFTERKRREESLHERDQSG